MTDPNCIFCKIVAGQKPCFKLLEDDDTLAFMDIYPANDGHCLVAAKDHYPTVFEISDDAFAAVSRSASRVARAINQALSPEGLNLVQANRPGAQQSVAHFHVHVLPRKRKRSASAGQPAGVERLRACLRVALLGLHSWSVA